MNIFEPLFLFLVLVTAICLITAAVLGAGGKFVRAGRLLKRLGIGALAYFGVVIVVSMVSPRREYRVGEIRCFDDWCITVVDARRAETVQGATYEVSLRLSNRGKRVPMGERGTVVYLTDAQGHRYDPLPDPAAVPFDTKLQPGESVMARRSFDIPRDAQQLGLVYTHEGGFPIEWLIITEGGWFQKPSLMRLN